MTPYGPGGYGRKPVTNFDDTQPIPVYRDADACPTCEPTTDKEQQT